MKNKLYRICRWTGSCLLLLAMVSLFLWQGHIRLAKNKMQTTLTTIKTAMPRPQNAVAEPRQDNTMPVLAADGSDYLGILEIPWFGSELPIRANWEPASGFPCRYEGNVYEGTLRIGATTQLGQYDFYRELSVGDAVYFTDMNGNRYSYIVTDLHYADHADGGTLQNFQGDLTIFIKNIYSRQYLILTCDTLG